MPREKIGSLLMEKKLRFGPPALEETNILESLKTFDNKFRKEKGEKKKRITDP